ncbi:GntR family transcriptional regulator [Achromobacter aloeverae]|uniref:GntR family transcriptional regulator n=1 Tax=Achromobacter aloeverae TaxID=1750518 RepID=A0A4Q1HQ02_9BURK|nr:GntR family transcriptional regulator [Achromobacter aloeverae]RXN93142.1 GntR family transcriptional regulator [Achromobacter aloeverae]
MARTLTPDPEPAQPSPLDRLNEGAGTPLYEIVKRQLSQKILFGDWGPGTVLPAEVALAKDLGVAVGTVRHALLELVREGLVSRRRGIGTVVTSRTHHHNLTYYFQYFRLHGRDESLQHSEPRVVSVGIQPADSRVAQKLQLADGAPVVRLHRVRVVDKRPVIHDTYFFAAERAPDFPMTPEKVPSRLHIFFLERYGVRVTAVRELLAAELANEDDRKLLDLKDPSAVLSIEDVAFDQTGAPVIYSLRRASTANHIYINEIK